jgi:hypothetical protein
MSLLRSCFILIAGAFVTYLCLTWVAQFFNLKDDSTPVIWIEALGKPEKPVVEEQKSFIELGSDAPAIEVQIEDEGQ